MAHNTPKNLKLYYSISEVAAKFGVAESLLRYWEKEFPGIFGRNMKDLHYIYRHFKHFERDEREI